MSVVAEIGIDGKITLYPSNFTEKYALDKRLEIAGNDGTTVSDLLHICPDCILQEGD